MIAGFSIASFCLGPAREALPRLPRHPQARRLIQVVQESDLQEQRRAEDIWRSNMMQASKTEVEYQPDKETLPHSRSQRNP
eukprot:jgi/Botrbrau1/6089/Bobra.177_1s0027.1